MKTPILKSYYNGLFFEFVLQNKLADAIIILPGFPGRYDYNELIESFYDRGYHVFLPRYHGSFQSTGSFLKKNPINDILTFIKNLSKNTALSLWDNQKKNFKINKKILVASDFSVPIACGAIAKNSSLFSHLIIASPIWDFKRHLSEGGMDLRHLAEFAKRAYQNIYRIEFSDIALKLSKFKETKPEFYIEKIKDFPIMILHDPNDPKVPFKISKEMSRKFNKVSFIEHYLGPGLSNSLINAYWKDIDKFIKINYI